MTRAKSESPGGAHGAPPGGPLLPSIVVAAATGLGGTDGSVSVSIVLLRRVNSRVICYARIFAPQVG
jgi:hypothetical protein